MRNGNFFEDTVSAFHGSCALLYCVEYVSRNIRIEKCKDKGNEITGISLSPGICNVINGTAGNPVISDTVQNRTRNVGKNFYEYSGMVYAVHRSDNHHSRQYCGINIP